MPNIEKHIGGIEKQEILQELQTLVERAELNVEEALSANTRKAYNSQWRSFSAWAQAKGLPIFPVSEDVLLVYLTDRAEKGAALSTLSQAYAAIREVHRIRDFEPPKLDGKLYRSWTGARKRASKSRTVKKALPLLPSELRRTLTACEGPRGTRDRAMLLIGWCGAMRSDEITHLNVEDVSVEEGGLRVIIRQSKTDQMGAGHEIGISRSDNPDVCPVLAWETHLMFHSGTGKDAAFASRTGQRLSNIDVGRILKRRMRAAGIVSKGYSAHSLRAGCISAAAQAGHPLDAIQRQSRHKSLEVLLGYIRVATLLGEQNITKGLL